MAFEPQQGIDLAPLTTWKIGGKAEYFASPDSMEGFQEALQWANEQGLTVTFLGRGSNVLISNRGISGLVLSTRTLGKQEPVQNGDILEVNAGFLLPKLAKYIASLGYTGYEFYIGIPGTVGGAVVMNAGFGPEDERQTVNRCVEVCIIKADGACSWIPYTTLNPRYRHTDMLEGTWVLGARFQLSECASPEHIRALTAEHLLLRRERQPLTRPTAGSVFKATEEGVPAAVFIDKAGLKGFRCGGAVVSLKHANWIENMGGASSEDVCALIEAIQNKVFNAFGIRLETEVRFLG